MRDVTEQIYWSLATEADLRPEPVPELAWDSERHCLMLQPSVAPEGEDGNRVSARNRAARPPLVVDGYDTFARAPEPHDRILVGGAAEPERELWVAPAGFMIRDMTWTVDGLLIVLISDGASDARIVWLDMLSRFDPVILFEPGFAADRVAASSSGGPIWLVDRGAQQVRIMQGTPVPDVLDTLARSPSVFAPKPEMADPPRIERPRLHDLSGGEIIDAIADETGALVLMRWPAGTADARLERIDARGRKADHAMRSTVLPYTMAPIGDGRVAVAVRGWPEARAYAVPDFDAELDGMALPLGLRMPLRDWADARLCTGATGRPHYPTTLESPVFRRLAPVSFAAFTRAGETSLDLIDSGEEGFVWHRLYLDAILPKGAAVTVVAAASDDAATLTATSDTPALEHAHRFGAVARRPVIGARGAWIDADSEKPWSSGPVDCPREFDRSGLFSCLMQRADGADNSRIKGRFLRLRLRLHGDGAVTPRLFGLRVWGPRTSYRDRFLPELFTIEEGPGARGSDFLERFLALFEGMLTRVEGDIALAYRLANPLTIPAEGLDWLAGWMGVEPDGALGEAGKRRLIASAAGLAPWRGTMRGLSGMLDIASEGGIAEGRLVVVEHFRMRRTFATILGADFDDRFDPMTRGTRANGNAYLGPGFFLGAEDEKLLFALFRPELLEHGLTMPDERRRTLEQLDGLFEDAAHRVTVLVHDETEPDRRALIARVLTREAPAHVIADLHDAPGSLILGLTALLGIETRTGPPPEIPGLRLDESRIGQGRLFGTPALDQRL